MQWCIVKFMFLLAISQSVHISGIIAGSPKRQIDCLYAPSICTPPENYCSEDGFIGNCQLPIEPLTNMQEWSYNEHNSALDYEYLKAALQYRNYLDEVRYHQILTLANFLSKIKYDHIDIGKMTSSLYKEQSYERKDIGKTKHAREAKRSADISVNPDSRHILMKAAVERELKILKDHNIGISQLTSEGINILIEAIEKRLKNSGFFNPEVKTEDRDLQRSQMATMNPSPNRTEPRISSTNFYSKKADEKREHLVSHLDENDSDAILQSKKENGHVLTQKSTEDQKPEFMVVVPKNMKTEEKQNTLHLIIIIIGATLLLIITVTVITCCVRIYRQKAGKKFIDSVSYNSIQPLNSDYQELCRQHYASKNSEQMEESTDQNVSTSSQEPVIACSHPDMKQPVIETITLESSPPNQNLVEAVNHTNQATAGNSSMSSALWCEEPITTNLDITTGHAVLSYMEDHLMNKNRLDKEWEEICNYEADGSAFIANNAQNARKNRSVSGLPFDYNRIKLDSKNNDMQSDYINASAIIDNDPNRPLYIAAQGPLASTIPDFWQMMWEQGSVAIVMLTPLVEEGVNQCARYWPDEGSCTYGRFEIHLVSEHIWCEDYLVRSLYLKNLETSGTRTVTQFHFLSWPTGSIPSTPKPLLELRRKVTKCYKGHNSPVLIHCSDGVDRTGTYILLDLVIDRMLKGAKEIDIAATLEHIRDQRSGMVGTKEQFEFALNAVAEEVNAILKSLLQ